MKKYNATNRSLIFNMLPIKYYLFTFTYGGNIRQEKGS